MKMSPSVDIDTVLVFTLDWFGCEGGVKCSLEGLGISVVLDGKGILMLKGLKKRRWVYSNANNQPCGQIISDYTSYTGRWQRVSLRDSRVTESGEYIKSESMPPNCMV